MMMVREMCSPGDDPDWLSVDNGDIRVEGLRGAGLKLSRQEEQSLDVFLKRGSVPHHVDVTDHGHCHPQVATYTPSIHDNQY